MESNNIISKYKELYDQIQNMCNSSKAPKIFAKIRISMYKKKLLKSVDKLYKANIPMNTGDVIDMLTNIQSNNLPDGAYKNLEYITIDYNIIRTKISTDTYKAYITIHNNDHDHMDLNLKYIDHNMIGLNLNLKEFKGNKLETKDILAEINSLMWSLSADYIKESILT